MNIYLFIYVLKYTSLTVFFGSDLECLVLPETNSCVTNTHFNNETERYCFHDMLSVEALSTYFYVFVYLLLYFSFFGAVALPP
eukprot:gene2060-1246_t